MLRHPESSCFLLPKSLRSISKSPSTHILLNLTLPFLKSFPGSHTHAGGGGSRRAHTDPATEKSTTVHSLTPAHRDRRGLQSRAGGRSSHNSAPLQAAVFGCKQQKQTLADLKQGNVLRGWGHSQNQETAEKEAGRVGNNDNHGLLEQELINHLVRALLRAQCYLPFGHFG